MANSATPGVLTAIDATGIERLRQRGMMAAGAGLVVGGIGAILQPAQILPSWLIGFYFCLGLSLGSLTLLMTQHLSGGKWGLVTRRIFEAPARHCWRCPSQWPFSHCWRGASR